MSEDNKLTMWNMERRHKNVCDLACIYKRTLPSYVL